MAFEPSPKDVVRIVGDCVEALSEISRDPAVYGDAAAALALGTLCFYADPKKVVGRDAESVPDGGFVVLAVLSHLDTKRAAELARGSDLFKNAAQSVKPFLARAQHLLVKAGQTFPVATVLERARGRVEQAAAQVVGIQLPDLDPAPYKTLVGVMRPNAQGEVELDAGFPNIPDEKPGMSSSKKRVPGFHGGAAPAEAPQSPPEPAAEGEEFALGEKDDALSTDERTFFRGYRADRKTVVSLQEFKSSWMLRDEYRDELAEWVARQQKVKNPHVAHVIGVYRPPGRLFLVYEALDGQTLAQMLARGPMEESEVMATMEAVAQGLKAYHAVGLVHRGMRPDRILIDRDGEVKVFDSPPPRPNRPAGEEETLREKGLKGEVRYMSPELCLGQEGGGQPPTDVYSLGLIVCEMMLGEQNLQRIAGESVKFWLNWHVDLYKKAIPLAEIDPEISPELSELVNKMLEKRTKNRYQDCAALLADLAAFRTGKKKAKPPVNTAQAAAQKGNKGSGAAGGGMQTSLPPRMLAMLAGVVGMMFLLLFVIIIKNFSGGDDGVQPTVAPDDPCKKMLEDALTKFRREDFDGTIAQLDDSKSTKCPPATDSAINGLRRDVQRARSLRQSFDTTLKRAKEAEATQRTVEAITNYQEATKAFKELSLIIQQPDRVLPDDLASKMAQLEPVRLLEEAKAAMKALDPDNAKYLAYRILDNYPTSPVAGEADELAKKALVVMNHRKTQVKQFDDGRDAFAREAWLEAAQCFWQSKLAHDEVQRLTGANKPVSNDLKERLEQLWPKLWTVRTPQAGREVVADELLIEISVPERFFKEVRIGRRPYPVKGDLLTLKISDLPEGNQVLDVSTTAIDGHKSSHKVSFKFTRPVEPQPQISIKAISGSKGEFLAEIVYTPDKGAEESFTVKQGWVSPDGRFRITGLTQQGIRIVTSKRKEHFYPY